MSKSSSSADDPISAAQKKLVQDSFAAVAPNAEAAADLFYGRLFELDPSLRPFFKGDMKKQGRKLMTMLKTAVAGLDSLDKLVPAVQDLGRRHAGYGVKPDHYNTVAAALLWALEQGLKDGFTPDVKAAWTTVYGVLADTMKSAAAAQPTPAAQPAPEHTMKSDSTDTTDNTAYRQMVDDMPVGVMMCDTENFEINYMNKFSTETLKTLQEHLPVKVDDMVGQTIDVFHKVPAHQREILSDPKNLPHSALIQVGPETLDLLVTAVHDKDGNYMGPMLTWSVVTAKVKADAQAAQLTQMVEGMPVGVMMCDTENFEINYMNKFSIETLKTLQEHLPVNVDDMTGQSIDVFHKDASHQRKILSDPSNLPHKALIQVGPETLDLLVTAIHDKDGNYMGPMLTWSVVTEKVKAEAESERLVATLAGIGASQAMIEFEMDGTIITANENFLGALGYQLSEIEGKNHSLFAEAKYKESPEYREFWGDLRNGKFQAGEFLRIHKDGSEVWIQASYNPILGPDGKPYKVVKNAVDITHKKIESLKIEAESARLVQMIEEMPINIMTLDPKDFTINYVNKTSLTTLKPLEHMLPVRLDELVGSNVDVFHKNPAHQRKILSDPNNLPCQAKIKLGDETLDLKVSAINDKDGNYTGPMLSWAVITGQVRMADDFETNVKGVVEIVSSSATELQATAQSLSATAEETNRQATSVAAAAEEASTNVQTVASAAEQLASSISEIGRQVEESNRISGQAATQAKETNAQVESLASAANKIGEVVELISDIASQTNLLALNATIEAARAGEAGKGFAVVASEVKSLATQTAKATDEIAGQINAIQAATTDAVSAIKEIGTTIESINDIAGNVASAVEEQGAATKEIAHSVQQASAGTTEVSSNITGVTQAASESGTSATEVLEAASGLAKQSENLRGEVDKFLVQVRAV